MYSSGTAKVITHRHQKLILGARARAVEEEQQRWITKLLNII